MRPTAKRSTIEEKETLNRDGDEIKLFSLLKKERGRLKKIKTMSNVFTVDATKKAVNRRKNGNF